MPERKQGMSTQVQHRRGTAAQHESFTGAMSEFTHDTTKNSIRVHDGITEGGHATIMEKEKGVAGGVAPLNEDTLIPEEFLLNAPVGDGSVTDPKLPDYDPGTSPSAAKIRFMASTSSGAIAGAVSRPLDAKLSENLHAADFGVKADGVTNDTTAMVNALEAAKILGRGLTLPRGVIMCDPDVLSIGPMQNNVRILGAGNSAYMPEDATLIRATQAGAILFDLPGFSEGHDLSGFVLDCAGLVETACRIVTVNNFKMSRFAALNFTGYGMAFRNNSHAPDLVSWSSNFTIEDFFIASQSVKDYGAGLYMSGTIDEASPPGPADPHLFTFRQGRVEINKGTAAPTFGGDFGFVDSGQFIEVDFVGKGGGALFHPRRLSTHNNSGEPFPVNLTFQSCSMQGGTTLSDDLHGKIFDLHYVTGDGEVIPEGLSKVFGITDTGYMYGDWSIEKLVKQMRFIGAASADRTLVFSTSDFIHQARIVHNSSLGLELEVWNGGAWVLMFRATPDGFVGINLPGVGFKNIVPGAPDSSAPGYRTLMVAN